ncbi:MAG TPA: AraC family transcriptional regulator ligand-binding domain-containing protein [Candidatus Binatia bacterium]
MSLDGAVRVLLAELTTVGLDPRAVCAAEGLPQATLDDGTLAREPRLLARVLERAQRMAAEPLLGLRMAERARGRGVLAYLTRAQRTVGDALEAFARAAARSWGMPDVVQVERGERTAVVRFALGDEVSRHAVEYLVGRTAIALRRDGAPPLRIAFRHAPGVSPRVYEEALRCPVSFRQPATEVVLRATDLARPLRAANPEAAALLRAAIDEAPSASVAAARTSARARLTTAVGDALARGARLDRETLARSLGMSGKTLARRLAAEGVSYRDVVDEVRRTLACRLLANEHGAGAPLPLGEIALRVGFADLAAFGKACRRWFGTSPSAVRAMRRVG